MVHCRADSSASHNSFYRHAWIAVARVGLPGIYFQDLRHAGNTLTADTGASLRELMDRMGRSSTRAALIYLHSSDETAQACRCGRRTCPRDARQDRESIWHGNGTKPRSDAIKPGAPAGFEPATRCLEGIPGASRDVAWRRSTSHLTAIIVAECRRESRGVGLHWLPD
jgi:hypothetical protein